MRFIGVVTIIWLLLVSQCWSSDAAYSPRINKLLKDAEAAEAKAGTNRPISFVTSTERGGFQGFTTYTDDGRIVITLPPPSDSPDYDAAIRAHELTHIILNSRGFAGIGPRQAPNAETLFPENLRELAKQQLIPKLAVMLNSCFSDELIDRDSAKRGFNPQLIVQKEMDEAIEGFAGQPSSERWPDVGKHLQAMTDFCLLIRLPSEATRSKYEAASAPTLGPSIDALRKRLFETFKGKRCEIDKPEACFPLTLQLRGAAGLKNVILLPKPKTWTLE